MNHWQLFTDSFGKLLHPVLWLYGLVAVLGSSSLGVVLLFDNQLLRSLATQTPQALRATLTSLAGVLLVVGVIGFVFATFGGAALIHLINRLEMRERLTVGMGLDAGEKNLSTARRARDSDPAQSARGDPGRGAGVGSDRAPRSHVAR